MARVRVLWLDDEAALYAPPRPGLPFILVTVGKGEITAFMPVWSRAEAERILGDRAGERGAGEAANAASLARAKRMHDATMIRRRRQRLAGGDMKLSRTRP